MSEKTAVAVLLGGRNSENYRSCQSARDVIDALEEKGYQVTAYGMSMEANWISFGDLNSLKNALKKDNFELTEKIIILNASVAKTNRLLSTITNNTEILKFKRKVLNLYETEYYNRVALSLSCVILFFIGAPLGSIVRKGGFGMPMILAIAVYVIYHFSNTFGKGLAENSSITAFLGSWIAAIMTIPIAILLTNRATKDKGIFNIDTFFKPITEFFKKFIPSKKQ